MGLFDSFITALNETAKQVNNPKSTSERKTDPTANTMVQSIAILAKHATASNQDIRQLQEEQMWQEKQEDDMWEEYRLEQRRQRDEETDEAYRLQNEALSPPWNRSTIIVHPKNTQESSARKNNRDRERRHFSMNEQDLSQHYNEGSSIDNSDLSDDLKSQNHCFSIRLNNGSDRFEARVNGLAKSERILCERYPLFKRIESEERLPMIINAAFPDGIQRRLYIRNLSFSDNTREAARLGIRPEIQHGNQLFDLLGEGNALLFIGHIRGREFVVDRIMDAANTECLPYEVDCVAIAYADISRIEHDDIQFLYDIREDAESLIEYTGERLTDWKEYLRWREEIVKRQIKGCKYFQITVDEDKAQLIFHLVFDSQEHFKQFRKYLYRDIQAFSNDYSKNKWHFVFAYDENTGGRRRFYRSVELGRCRGIRNEYQLRAGYDSVADPAVEEDAEDEASADYESFEENEFVFDSDTFEYSDEPDGTIGVSDILREYKTPYIVEVAYDVNSSDADRMRDLEDDAVVNYIYNKILPQYEEQGFLALSAVGEFSVIERQKKAVQTLEHGDSYSPNLGAWLFNVKQARIPAKTECPVAKWLNPDVESNESQRKAVQGMLCTEDVCLVQGPPGTGKTTVIAEAVYQMVVQGKRVLIASQSNDAVDNALERLATTPEIRAIRMGQAARRKRRGEDFTVGKYSEENSLYNYYQSLANTINETWLHPWDEIQDRSQHYEHDLRDLDFLSRDIEDFQKQRHNCEEHIRSLQNEITQKQEERSRADKHNNESIAERNYFEQFKKDLEKKDTELSFYLSAAQLQIVEECVAPVIKLAGDNGILIVPYGLSANQLGIDGANNSLTLAFYQISQIKGISARISATKQAANGHSVEADRLCAEIDRLQALIDNAEYEQALEYLKQKKIKQKELKKLRSTQSALTLTASEKSLFEPRFTALLEEGKKDEVGNILGVVVDAWQKSIDKAVQQIEKYQESKTMVDTAPIVSELKKLEGRLVLAREEQKQATQALEEKQNQVSLIARKYDLATGDSSAIERHIVQLQNDNNRQARQQAQVRGDWEDVLRKFSSRLTDEKLFPYDREFYLNTYIQSCNVVGTSCTDRILTGSDLGDFDVVIIDEVSKVTPPELLLPLMKARKAILVGDHRQLPPMFDEHERSYSEIIESEDLPDDLKDLLTMQNFKRFKKMVTASLFKDMFESADDSIKYSLLTQYRMHKDIMDIINRFYDNRLERGLSDEKEAKQKNHGLMIKGLDGGSLIVPDSHAYWFDSSALPSGTPVYDSFYYAKGNSRSTSAFNALEYYMILELLKKLDQANKEAGGQKKTVGVISFYQRQITELRNAVKRMRKELSFLDIDINTVDRFQGKEKQIIITSLVRNNPQARAGQHVVAFERINVAFSRAQELLIIVGARHMYENLMVQLPNMTDKGTSTVAVYKNIINLLERKASFKSSAKLLNTDMENDILKKCQESGDGR